MPDDPKDVGDAASERARARRTDPSAQHAFLDLVGHELRTPLTVIVGYARLLGDREMDAPEAAMVRAVMRASAHLHMLVESILSYSDLLSGQCAMRAVSACPASVARSACEIVRPHAQERHRALDLDTDGAPRGASFDERHLRLVLVALLRNALDHGGGRVRLMVRAETAAGVTFVVADDGAPVPEETLASIFEPFGIGTPIDTRQRDGIGLGLPLARRIAELHGGSLVLRQNARGKSFEVRLPPTRAAA